jgi:excisionase family DNA binding protein
MAELLKSREVAALLRVHPKQVYRLLAQGLPARRVGGEWRFRREEVLAWSEQQSAGDTTSAKMGSATLAPTGAPPPPLLAANGDVVIEVLLAGLLAADKPLLGFLQADRASAIHHLEARSILLAGYHGDQPPSHVDAARLARIHLVNRQVGLAHPERVRLRGLSDLKGKRLATRPRTAGVRAHLDHALAGAGLSARGLHLEAVPCGSHRDAVLTVVRDEADVALTTSAWAAQAGLRFLSIATESYDLLLFAENLGTPHAVAVCELAQTSSFRAALHRLAGYDARRAGEIRYELDAPPR